jgi:cytochrome c oxidase cbb3-type subunit 3
MLKLRTYLLIAAGLLLGYAAAAQAGPAAPVAPAARPLSSQEVLFWVLVGLLALVLVVALLMGIMVIVQMRAQLRRVYELPTVRPTWSGKVLGLLVGDPVLVKGEVKDELLDHDYDGIHEFDNDLPPWWKYGFYASIGFGFLYLGYYHLLAAAPLSQGEYALEMQQASLLLAAEPDDPTRLTTYQPLRTPADLAAGQTVFAQNCAACHGQQAEGKVGPNLTDEYWLHGGEINHVYRTIRFGVQSKGMVAWKGKLSAKQLLQVSSYVLSLQGSRPAGAKAPQGQKEAPGAPLASR